MSIAPNEGAIQGDDSITARTSDGQEIFVDASVIYAIDPNKVVQVHIDWQKRYDAELVRPLARGVIRDVVSQYKVEEVVTSKRVEMISQISTDMNQKLQDNGLSLVNFILRNITFSPEYAASVEQKQVAEQLAQQAKFVVEQRRQEAEQARQVAQGQADAVVINAQGAADARIIQAQAEAQASAADCRCPEEQRQTAALPIHQPARTGHPGDARPERQPLFADVAHPSHRHTNALGLVNQRFKFMSQPENTPSGRQIRLTTLSSCAG